jgi:penicillin-binding protein 1A
LQAGAWVGCDDRFITLESSAYYGGSVARPIWEAFFKKVYADKTLGIERDAKFARPAEMENEIYSADLMHLLDELITPGAEGEDQGAGKEQDFNINNREYIPPESQPVQKEENKSKKDTTSKSNIEKPKKPEEDTQQKKKGFFQKIFGKKEN